MAISSLKFGGFNPNAVRDQYQFLLGQRKEVITKRTPPENTIIKPIAKAPPVAQPPILERPIAKAPPIAQPPVFISQLPETIAPIDSANEPTTIQPQQVGVSKPLSEIARDAIAQEPSAPVEFGQANTRNFKPSDNSNARDALQAVYEKLAARFDVGTRAYQSAAVPKQQFDPILLPPPVNELA